MTPQTRTYSLSVAFLAIFLLHAALPLSNAADLIFSEQSESAGLAVQHEPSLWLEISKLSVSSMLGGGAIGDFNNDGYQDLLFLAGGAVSDKLFINDGNGTFSQQAAQWGVDYAHMGVGTAVGDYNNDGWLDIFVTSLGPATGPTQPGQHILYRNNGDNTFTNVAAEAGVQTISTAIEDGFGATFGDYDLDGDLDLMVVGWVPASGSNLLFQNNNDGTFSDITSQANLDGLIDCRGFSPRFIDMNGDLYPELLIAADFGTSRYLINNGDGTFTDATAESGTALDGNGMGHTVGDYDNDGRPDWHVTSIYSPDSQLWGVPGTGNMLYMNLGGDVFVEDSSNSGVNDGGWGWGTVSVDFNHDGLIDIAETNGWFQPNGSAGQEWLNERCYVFQNLDTQSFVDVAENCGVLHNGLGRGLANLDYDNDGDQDIVVFAYSENLTLYRNDVSGAGCNWLRVFLDTSSEAALAPQGIGSKVSATVGDQVQIRFIDAGSNYLVQSELSAHFGVGSATSIDELRIDWNDGRTSKIRDLAVNHTIVIAPVFDPADLNQDGDVGAGDLAQLLGHWGPCAADCPADLNGDGVVGPQDLAQLLGSWS